MASAGRKVKFVASDPRRGGLPVKRKQVQQACASCRRKKRRCIHADDSFDESGLLDESVHIPRNVTSTSPPPRTSPASMGKGLTSGPPLMMSSQTNGSDTTPILGYNVSPGTAASRTEASPADHSSTQPSRFVGDSNPEGIFMEATVPEADRQSSRTDDVGIWFSATNGSSAQPSQFITSRPPQVMDRFLLPFVKEHCLTCLPPNDDYLKLKALFYQKVHPMFPVIPPEALQGSPTDPTNIVLRQLVCLAAATDCESSQSLRLQDRGQELLPPQEFGQSMSSAIRAILETSIIADRVLHIRALTILSLYTQPTCAEEADLPAQLGGRAIHHIQTLGLHLLRYSGPNCNDLENLFCAVWALDRINSAIYGRPVLIHERDTGLDLESCIKRRPPCFRLLLSVVQWLEQVIELYRPGPSAEASGLEKIAYIDLPVLEAMIVDADALKVPSPLIATIETLYHAVIILSCRLPRPGTAPAASTLPPPSANARRSLAAERIACAVPRDHLSPVPFVPYAVSLALSVEYRKMRHSRLPMFRARAMNAFRRNCEMLRPFRDYFWNANVVAKLGERVLKEMERAATTLTRDVSPLPSDGIAKTAQPAHDNSLMGPGGFVFGDPTAINSAPGMDNMVDFSLIDAISGQDVFGHIDPSFNMTAVEDALEANLDVGLPLNWGDWGQFTT